MKKITALLSMLILIGLSVRDAQAQENKNPLWLMAEEVVKPAMVEQYYEVSKELVEFCKAENFPYSFNVWVSQPFHYTITYPMEDMNDITKIYEAWDALIEKHGLEKFKRFEECIESQKEKVMIGLLKLCHIPEPPRLSDEDITYCYWQEVSVKKGSEKAVEDLFKKAVGIMEEKGSDLNTYIGKGSIGFDRPVYFAWYYGKDQIDFLEQEKKFGELVGEEWKEINSEIIKHIKGIKNVDYWRVKDLSYQKEAPQ